jgi:iron(III) transport system permease protein
LALKNTVILGTATATIGTAIALVIAYVTDAPGGERPSRPRFPRHRAGRHSRHRARRRIVPELHAAAFRAVRHVMDPADRFCDHQRCRRPISNCRRPSATIHPNWKTPAASSAPPGCARWEITAPLLRTGVIATWCFIFVGVMRELSAAIILFTSETKVISVLIYDLNESGDLGAISVLGIGMLIITFSVVIAVNRIPGFGSVRFRNT